MNEKLCPEIVKSEIPVTPINAKAREGNFSNSEIFGITDDLAIVLNLLRKEGLVVPSSRCITNLRGEFTALLGQFIIASPLYLH